MILYNIMSHCMSHASFVVVVVVVVGGGGGGGREELHVDQLDLCVAMHSNILYTW